MRMNLSIVTAAWIIIWTLVYSLPVQAGGYGGGYYSGGHYGYRHYGHHGYRHGRYGYGYGHYGHYGYHRGPYYTYRHSGYYSPGYYQGRHHSTHGHGPLYTLLSLPANLAYGILKTPVVIVDSLTRPYSTVSNASGENSSVQSAGAGTATTQPGETYINQPAKDGVRTMDSGWDALAQGRYRDALHLFRNLAEANPEKGTPKAGYALAAAADGDLDRGIWAMKRALQYDADSLNYLRMDMNLESTLAVLIGHYQVRMNNSQDAGSGLMLASLYYLSGNLNAARETIELTRQYGHSDNLARLGDLISQHEN